jgi:hypothetical protein
MTTFLNYITLPLSGFLFIVVPLVCIHMGLWYFYFSKHSIVLGIIRDLTSKPNAMKSGTNLVSDDITMVLSNETTVSDLEPKASTSATDEFTKTSEDNVNSSRNEITELPETLDIIGDSEKIKTD